MRTMVSMMVWDGGDDGDNVEAMPAPSSVRPSSGGFASAPSGGGAPTPDFVSCTAEPWCMPLSRAVDSGTSGAGVCAFPTGV